MDQPQAESAYIKVSVQGMACCFTKTTTAILFGERMAVRVCAPNPLDRSGGETHGTLWATKIKNYDTPRGALIFVTTVGDYVIQHVCNVGKSRKPNLDMRSIY